MWQGTDRQPLSAFGYTRLQLLGVPTVLPAVIGLACRGAERVQTMRHSCFLGTDIYIYIISMTVLK